MHTRDIILAAALRVLEEEGEAQFSTRAVQAIANVTAPTIYHHFRNADDLLSAAIAEAFRRFLESKKAAVKSPDPETALREGWDDYVRFAAARPRVYAAMLSRFLKGGDIPAADEATALLIERIRALAAEGRLAVTVEAAADQVWASANAASLLYVTAQQRKASRPNQLVIDELRERTLQTILNPRQKD
jgi:AcrR family transcriptional regulator